MQAASFQFRDIAADKNVRPLSYTGRVSWEKTFDDAITFFQLDVSVLNGIDILASSEDNPIQEFDYYEYVDITDRMRSLEVSRTLEFPYSVASAIADFSLENHDDYYTPGSGSAVAPFVLPSRPMRLFMGFNGENLQQFVGLTDGMPTIDDKAKTVDFSAIDWFGKLFNLQLPNIIAMQNVTTDEVLAEIFDACGLLPTQYVLEKGRNIIKFVSFEAGLNVGNVIKRLMEAELGQLFMDEQGVIRFLPRLERDMTPDYEFDDTNIIDIKTINVQNIINVVQINATIREVQVNQPIFTLTDSFSDDYVIPASSSKDIFVSLPDPAISATEPSEGEDSTDSYFVATNEAGDVVGSVTVSSDFLFTDSYRITFANANAFDVRISQLVVWGEPAKVIDTIKYTRKDEDSILKYEERVLTIDNDFIQSIDACDSFALLALDSYAEYSGDIEMEVRGTPALQLGDVIDVTKETFTGQYRITKIVNQMVNPSSPRFSQILNGRRYIPRDWFILDESVLDGTSQLAP